MDYLPAEIIQDILSRLPIKSLLQSRCVCKIWRTLVKDPRLANMQLARASQNQNPSLLLYSDSNLYSISDYETSKNAFKLNNLPFKSWLPIFKIMGSCNGLVCLADHTYCYRSIFVCNPVTGEYTKLPDTATVGKVNGTVFGFGFDHINNEYKVVRMRNVGIERRPLHSPQLEQVEVHTVGTDFWRNLGNIPVMIGERGGSSGVLVNGNLHWLGVHSTKIPFAVVSIVALRVCDEEFIVVPLPDSVVGKDRCRVHLGVLGGCLFVVDDCYGKHIEVWVMQNYGMKESWTKQFTIKHPMRRGSRRKFKRSRPLGIQKNGKLLLECDNETLFSYDPRSRRFEDLGILGLPNLFEAVPHVVSLVSLTNGIAAEGQQ